MKDSELIRTLAQGPAYKSTTFMCIALSECRRPDLHKTPSGVPEDQILRLQAEIQKRIRPYTTLACFLNENRGLPGGTVTFSDTRAYYMRMARQLAAKGR